jgi:hypothetical protein
MGNMEGTCALYRTEGELRNSHILPKFIIKHSKKTGSKYQRRVVKPNIRIQDGIKIPLLSPKGEQEFGKREKWFAENIFHPYLKSKYKLPYNENLFYFAISLLWRIIHLELRMDKSLSEKWHYQLLLDCEKEWRDFLTVSIFPRNHSSCYLWFTDRVEFHTTELEGVDYYMTRMNDLTIISNPEKTYLAIYAKFNRFIFFSVLKSPGGEDNLTALAINPIRGTYDIPQQFNYWALSEFLTNRIHGISKHNLASEDQQEKIYEEIAKDPEAFWESDAGQSLYNDHFNLKK